VPRDPTLFGLKEVSILATVEERVHKLVPKFVMLLLIIGLVSPIQSVPSIAVRDVHVTEVIFVAIYY
jgi:hypothetical protein